ncbi:MAG: diphosphomevalonate decarboxylase [Mariniphaga sp.]
MSEEIIIIGWKAPSNIALVKYWGKRGNQLPENGSLSITLENSTTTTFLSFQKKSEKGDTISLKYYFHKEQVLPFEKKTELLLNKLCSEMPFLVDYELVFHSENNFPHSTGIASSASSMSALALCLVSMEEIINANKLENDEFFRRASRIARLGSGSASRSVYGGLVSWGSSDSIANSSDEYATPFLLHEGSRLNKVMDIILIVSSKEKSVSSTKGHALMSEHPYREARKMQANNNLIKITEAIRNDDYQSIAAIAENEALSLHALLMTSGSDGLLLKPNTLYILEEIKRFRETSGLDLFFTIDAGPNVHLIYYEDQREQVLEFVRQNLSQYCEDGRWIDDQVGSGPQKITSVMKN